MLLWALLPFNPYSYYVLLRWVVCLVFAWQCTMTRKAGMWVWTVFLLGISILYNPLVAVSLPRGTWRVVNLLSVVALLALPFAYGRRTARVR